MKILVVWRVELYLHSTVKLRGLAGVPKDVHYSMFHLIWIQL